MKSSLSCLGIAAILSIASESGALPIQALSIHSKASDALSISHESGGVSVSAKKVIDLPFSGFLAMSVYQFNPHFYPAPEAFSMSGPDSRNKADTQGGKKDHDRDDFECLGEEIAAQQPAAAPMVPEPSSLALFGILALAALVPKAIAKLRA
ncbi:MAG: hypothetical protein JWP91_977 [Fibrobacteres bacterium]|nr:hypothetical protein [Fibrobacterota bacterium]